VTFSILLLLKLFLRVQAGQNISEFEWIVGASAGVIVFLLLRLALSISLSRTRYMEFKGGKVDLAGQGKIALNRIREWSLRPDAVAGCLRLQIVYKFGLGKKRWSMLLDDRNQAEQLKIALESAAPLTASQH